MQRTAKASWWGISATPGLDDDSSICTTTKFYAPIDLCTALLLPAICVVSASYEERAPAALLEICVAEQHSVLWRVAGAMRVAEEDAHSSGCGKRSGRHHPHAPRSSRPQARPCQPYRILAPGQLLPIISPSLSNNLGRIRSRLCCKGPILLRCDPLH